MAKKNALNISFEVSKPAVAIEVRYFPKSEDGNERVGVSWKSRGAQPQWRALPAREQHQLLDLLLKLCRSALPTEATSRRKSMNSAKRAASTSASAAP